MSAVYLQQFPSYSNHKCKKIVIFYVTRPSFFVCPGDAPAAITQNVAWMKRQFSAWQTPRSMYPSIFNSFPVIRTASAKIAVFTYCSPHFCFPWRRPCDYHAICCTDRKTIQCLPNPSHHVPICLQYRSFWVIRCLSQCVSPKITIFTTFLFPLGTPRGNRAKCCMDRKRIRCLQIVSQHVGLPIYLQQFPSYSNRKYQK